MMTGNQESVDKSEMLTRLKTLKTLIRQTEKGRLNANLGELSSLEKTIEELLRQAHPDADRKSDKRDQLLLTHGQWDNFLNRFMACADLMDVANLDLDEPEDNCNFALGEIGTNISGDEGGTEKDTHSQTLDECAGIHDKELDPKACQDAVCLLFETPPVGVFSTTPRQMVDALLGRLKEGGVEFKLGKGKVKAKSVEAAHALIEREFPQVNTQHCLIIVICF